jgi:glycosyltransferase involved in cell wall biosynthesis
MIRQLPTVVSDLPALCEIIEHRKTGMTFPTQDIQALSSVIRELASNPSLRKEIGINAREYVLRERTWPDIVHSYNEIYQRI